MTNSEKWNIRIVEAVGTTVQAYVERETSTCTYHRTLVLNCRALTRREAVGLAFKVEMANRIDESRWTIHSESITRTDAQAEIYQEYSAAYGYEG